MNDYSVFLALFRIMNQAVGTFEPIFMIRTREVYGLKHFAATMLLHISISILFSRTKEIRRGAGPPQVATGYHPSP
jgi:hypothetical protein